MNNLLTNARGAAGFSNILPLPGQAATPPQVAPGIRVGHQGEPSPTACPHCQSTDLRVTTGSGPHVGRLSCGGCGRWVKWLSKGEVEARGGFAVQQLDLLGGVE